MGAGSLVLCLCRIPLRGLLFLIFFLAAAQSKFVLIAECCQRAGEARLGALGGTLCPFIQLLGATDRRPWDLLGRLCGQGSAVGDGPAKRRVGLSGFGSESGWGPQRRGLP